ncbi:putative transposase of IS4/5 family DUF4096 [Aliiruegeria haliotis]|uniref:Putative transposase of IS4/5 family DUF4096 n=1 Tax=Aliiruegeria haliotis TaxID=1280846 RepID=A0A2T0RGF7_9RHOB|nr:putative transposase of IS4/5 family DUF4096 [Aliiruegeria haliotis]
MAWLEPYFPKSHGKPRVDDRRVPSGIIFINCNGLLRRDVPAEFGPHETLYNRCKRWSDKGVFARIMTGFAAEHSEENTAMIDASVDRPANLDLTRFRCNFPSFLSHRSMIRALSMSIFARPYIWRFGVFWRLICPLVWRFDQGSVSAAAKAAWSVCKPRAEEASMPVSAASSQGISACCSPFRTMRVNQSVNARALERAGMAASTRVMRIASAMCR